MSLLREAGMPSLPGLSEQQVRAVLAWGVRLRPAFTDTDLERRVGLLNDLLAESACEPYISTHDGRAPHLHYASERADPVRRVMAFTAGGTAHALCADPSRITQCASHGCNLVFVDTSRNGRRRFCGTRCATRTYVAEHRERNR